MKDTKLQLEVFADGKLDIDMREQVTTLKEVIVSSKKLININRVQMGVERLSIDNIRRIPSVFGEADVLRVITSLPGVKTVGEASTGFNVRGGSADQNLFCSMTLPFIIPHISSECSLLSTGSDKRYRTV